MGKRVIANVVIGDASFPENGQSSLLGLSLWADFGGQVGAGVPAGAKGVRVCLKYVRILCPWRAV